MLYYLKKYPISLTIIAVVIYLSFFKPPSLEVGKIVGIDKVAHLCMYAGLSGMLWIEFLQSNFCRNIVRHTVVATGSISSRISAVLLSLRCFLTSSSVPG